MTKEELKNLVGEQNADYVLDLILKNINVYFAESCVKAEMQENNEEIAEMQQKGFIYKANGFNNVSWKLKKDGTTCKESYESETLLYTKNRLSSILIDLRKGF